MGFKIKYLHPLYFLVRIDRKKQFEKRTKQGDLFLAPAATFMAHNQQCGEIMAIGHAEKYSEYREDYSRGKDVATRRVFFPSAQQVLPQAQVGDTLLFAHWIEGSVETKEGEQKEHDLQYLAYEDDIWRYYWVKHEFAYGVVKRDGQIFVTPDTIFAVAAEQEIDSREAVRVGSLYLLKNYKQNQVALQHQIEEKQALSLEYRDKRKALELQQEMEQLTKEKNKLRLATFIPAFVNERLNRDCGHQIDNSFLLFYLIQGSAALELQVLEIEVGDKKFFVLKPDYVAAVMKRPQMYVAENGLRFLNDETN